MLLVSMYHRSLLENVLHHSFQSISSYNTLFLPLPPVEQLIHLIIT